MSLDRDLLARCVDALVAWQVYAGKCDAPAPKTPSADELLSLAGITWGGDRARYLAYERAAREEARARLARMQIYAVGPRVVGTTCPDCGRSFPTQRGVLNHRRFCEAVDLRAEVEQVAAMYEDGIRVEDIARELRMSPQTAYNRLDAAGVERRRGTYDRRAS